MTDSYSSVGLVPFERNPTPHYENLKGNTPTHDADANPFDLGSGCTLDGVPIDCNLAMGMVNNGAAAVAPIKSVVPVTYLGRRTFAYFQAYADGYQGYVPVTAKYTGEGRIMSVNPPKVYRRGTFAGDTDLRALNGVSNDDDPEIRLARSVGFAGGGQNSIRRISVAYLGDDKYSSVTSRASVFHGILKGFVNNQDCVDAFSKLGIDLNHLLTKTGLAIGPAALLSQQAGWGAKRVGLTERQFDAGGRVWNSARALTVPQYWRNQTPEGPNTTDARPRIFMHHDIVEKGEDYLKEVLAHELVHAGVSRVLCKRRWLSKRQSPFKENRKLIQRRPPVFDRHSPFLADVLQCQINQLQRRLVNTRP